MITADKKLKKMARNDCVKNENMKDQKPKKRKCGVMKLLISLLITIK